MDDSKFVSQDAAQRPWSAGASLALYIVLFEAEWRVYDFVLTATGLQAFLMDPSRRSGSDSRCSRSLSG